MQIVCDKCTAAFVLKVACSCLLLILTVAVVILEQHNRNQAVGLNQTIKWMRIVLNFEHDRALENFATTLNKRGEISKNVADKLSDAAATLVVRPIPHLDAAFSDELMGNGSLLRVFTLYLA